MRQSLIEISNADGELILRSLQKQSTAKKRYELDAADRRRIAQRMVVRTETGEIEIEVPERDQEAEIAPPVEVDREFRASTKQTSRNLARSLASTFGILPAIGPKSPKHCRVSIAVRLQRSR